MPNTKTLSPEKLKELRNKAKLDRVSVAADRDRIATEAKEVIEEAVASGKLFRVAAVFRADEEAEVKQALTAYASEHGLQSYSQVVRAALSQLLGLNLAENKWGR